MLVDIKFVKFPRGKIGMRIKDMDESLRGAAINFRYGVWCIKSAYNPEIDCIAQEMFRSKHEAISAMQELHCVINEGLI